MPDCCFGDLTLVDIEGNDCITTSLEPCGDTGAIDLHTPNDFTDCGANPVVFSVGYYSTEGFSSVTINGNNVEFTTSNDAEPGVTYYIVYVATCGELTGKAKVSVCIEDLCDGVVCGATEVCNKCTGICQDAVIDLSVGMTLTKLNT